MKMNKLLDFLAVDITPAPGDVYWCAVCDLAKIHSHDKTTGTFMKVAGHVQVNEEDGPYKTVRFAVCKACLDE